MPTSLRSGRVIEDDASETGSTPPTVTDEICQLRRENQELRAAAEKNAATSRTSSVCSDDAVSPTAAMQQELAELRVLVMQMSRAMPTRVPENAGTQPPGFWTAHPQIGTVPPAATMIEPPAHAWSTPPAAQPITSPWPGPSTSVLGLELGSLFSHQPRSVWSNTRSVAWPPVASPPGAAPPPAAPPASAPPTASITALEAELAAVRAAASALDTRSVTVTRELAALQATVTAPMPSAPVSAIPMPQVGTYAGENARSEAALRTTQWVQAAIDSRAPAASWVPTLLQLIAQPQAAPREPERPEPTDAILNRASKTYELEPYSGDPAEWITFEAQYYKSSRQCRFSGMDNHARLSRCLRGPARSQVLHMLNGQVDCAEEIMSILRATYGLPKLVTACALNNITNFRPLPQKATLAHLLDLAVVVKNTASTLAAYPAKQVDEENLLMELYNKLPEVYRVAWVGHVYSRRMTSVGIQHFSDWLKEFRDAGALAGAPPYELHHIRQQRVATTLATSISQEEGPAPRNTEPRSAVRSPQKTIKRGSRECQQCRGPHDLSACKIFLAKSYEERRTFVRDNRVCFKCLIPGHTLNRCQSKKYSESGQSYHYTLYPPERDETVARS